MNEEELRAGQVGEFALIDRLRAKLSDPAQNPDVIVGNGDDAAVIDTGGGRCWVVSCDVQVQGVHFPARGASGYNVGHKSLAVNISDIAAMGARPRFALLSLGVQRDTPISFLDRLYEGINTKAARWNTVVLGGNVTRTDGPLFVDVFLIGEVRRQDLLLRGGARVGDQILVTGYLGEAAAGLHLLNHPQLHVRDDTLTKLTFAQLRPVPRVEEAAAIASLHLATAMMDVSDSLAGDIAHICDASGVGAVLWEHLLPISPAAVELASVARYNPLEWALYGGEDYQLLLTAPVEAVPRLREAVRSASGLSLTPIGEVVDSSQGIRLKRDEALLSLEARAWDHLRGEALGAPVFRRQ